MRITLIIIAVFLFTACTQNKKISKSEEEKKFTYASSGKLDPSKSGKGRLGDNYIYAPNIRFPIETAPAYINF